MRDISDTFSLRRNFQYIESTSLAKQPTDGWRRQSRQMSVCPIQLDRDIWLDRRPNIKMKGISSLKRTQRTYQRARYIPVEDILFESEKSETREAKTPNSMADSILPTTTIGYSKSSFTKNPHLLHVLTNQFPSPPTSRWLPSPTYAIYIYIKIYILYLI